MNSLIVVPFQPGLMLRPHSSQIGEHPAYVPKSCSVFLQSLIAHAKVSLLCHCFSSEEREISNFQGLRVFA